MKLNENLGQIDDKMILDENCLSEKETKDSKSLYEIFDKYKGKKGFLIPLLQEIQKELGYISKDSMTAISKEFKMPIVDIYGVATFYTQFRLEPKGKHTIKVCEGTACHVAGAKNIKGAISRALNVKDGQTTVDNKFTLESVACLGCCSLAPVIMIDEETFGRLSEDKVEKVLKNY